MMVNWPQDLTYHLGLWPQSKEACSYEIDFIIERSSVEVMSLFFHNTLTLLWFHMGSSTEWKERIGVDTLSKDTGSVTSL